MPAPKRKAILEDGDEQENTGDEHEDDPDNHKRVRWEESQDPADVDSDMDESNYNAKAMKS